MFYLPALRFVDANKQTSMHSVEGVFVLVSLDFIWKNSWARKLKLNLILRNKRIHEEFSVKIA